MLWWLSVLILLISLILVLVNLIISKKEGLDRNKISLFECGFDSLSSMRLPFSIHFYLIGMLFLVFDVEVIFLIPMISLFDKMSLIVWMFLIFMILLILYFGLEFEKNEGSLKWMI